MCIDEPVKEVVCIKKMKYFEKYYRMRLKGLWRIKSSKMTILFCTFSKVDICSAVGTLVPKG
jgi:hypothetical protein